jgi:hypothetical protein
VGAALFFAAPLACGDAVIFENSTRLLKKPLESRFAPLKKVQL